MIDPKEFPKNSQRIPTEFPQNSQRIPKNFPKNFPKNPQKIPKNSQRYSKKVPKNSQDFENIQFPTSHLEAGNPFGLGFFFRFDKGSYQGVDESNVKLEVTCIKFPPARKVSKMLNGLGDAM